MPNKVSAQKNKRTQSTQKSLVAMKRELKTIKKQLEEQGNKYGFYQNPKLVDHKIIHDLNNFIEHTIDGMIEINKALNALQSRTQMFKRSLSQKQRKAA